MTFKTPGGKVLSTDYDFLTTDYDLREGVSSNISNTRDSVSSDFQTPRSDLKI